MRKLTETKQLLANALELLGKLHELADFLLVQGVGPVVALLEVCADNESGGGGEGGEVGGGDPAPHQDGERGRQGGPHLLQLLGRGRAPRCSP